MKHSIVKVLLGICLLILMISWASVNSTARVATAYTDENEIERDIQFLPTIGVSDTKVTARVWAQYIAVARRLQVSKTNVINPAYKALTYEMVPNLVCHYDVKIMLLNRICFKCQNDARPTDVFGGWTSSSAEEAKRNISQDVNWPLGRIFGHFYLRDAVDGYLGQPYDPAKEFNWMMAHCELRNLN